MEILDIGCGDRPTGTINLDRYYYGKWKNFVIAEAHYLPFKNNVFDKIHASHCLEHFESPYKFFREAKRVLKEGGTLECVYPTDAMLTKKTIHNLLNLRLRSAFKWKSKIKGTDKITYGGHKWQLPDEPIKLSLKKIGYKKITFYNTTFFTFRVDGCDRYAFKWKMFFNKYLPDWQIETKLVAIA
ncbi:MAG: class I SAM-dependent methyltransferase [Clostridiales bacterium]|nr:class I SAM-dependent methyltransferase [Clostridiales bacterium]